jgi:PPOX class probable F420-dependent enzyme
MPQGVLPTEFDEFLAQPNPAVIATVNSDGRPNSVPTWCIWDGHRALVSMSEGQQRLANARRDPRVALTLLDKDDWFSHLSVRGRVTSFQDDPELADMDRLARHFTGEPYPMRDSPRVSVWIEVDSWHAFPPR